MTPEGKRMVNQLLAPHHAHVETPIEEGQDVRFVKITTRGASETPQNVLDDAKMMVHAEEPLDRQRARSVGRPLLRIMSVSHHTKSGVNVLSLEDINTKPAARPSAPERGVEYAGDREPRDPLPRAGQGSASVYPPGHPSLAGARTD
jgi:hypothetical protein